MATELQAAANRRNALMSTGPRSLAGKRRSSVNAVTHGLTAQHAMLPGEDPDEFNGLRHAIFNSLLPQGALENQLIERAASLIWRMRRFQVFEVALFQWTAYLQAEIHDRVDDPIVLDDVERRNDVSSEGQNHNEDLGDSLKLGRMFEAVLSADLTGKLSRYESALQRQLGITLKELRELKTIRPDQGRQVDETNGKEHGPRGPGLLGPP